MRERWQIDLMGAPRLRQGDATVIRLQNPKTDALLAYLAFYRQRPHSREELAELFWPEADSASARNRLSLALARLRQRLDVNGEAFASLLLADKSRIALNQEAVDVDVAPFEEAVTAARRATGLDARIATLFSAIRSYGGELLPGFYDAWALNERRRLADAYLAAHLSLSRLLRERNAPGDLVAAEGYARAAIALAPTQEEAYLELIRVLDAAGRRAEALRQFQELQRILSEELLETPSPEAVALGEHLRTQPAPGEVFSPATLEQAAGAAQQRRNWVTPPAPLTRFFGREAEYARIEALLAEGVRPITLLGPGGSGKTRLAIEAARRLSARFCGAVAWVPLAAVSEVRRVPDAIAEALRLDRQGSDDLVDHIAQRLAQMPSTLLVLDNLEHLLATDTAAELPLLLRRLLEHIPGLTLLMTSRQRVNIEGERELSVSPLPLPQQAAAGPTREALEQTPSVQLFVDRAQAIHPAFRLTNTNASAIATLCARLEGIPLAIELAAAWAQVLTPAQMLARLDDRFALLVSQRADSPERHRTLSAAIAYSYELLSEDLKRAFQRLSVFRGGWTIEAAEGLGVDMRTLTALRERSLIVTGDISPDPSDDGMRFMMLETLREFATARQTPEETAQLRRTHADYFLSLAEAVRPHLTSPDQATYFAQLQTEHENLRAALQWCVEIKDIERGLRLVSALQTFWGVRGHLVEGLDWLKRLEALPGVEAVPLALQANILRVKSRLYHWLGENDQSGPLAREALRLSLEAGDERGVAASWISIGNAEHFTGANEAARDAYERSLAIARAIGSEDMEASSLNNLGLTLNSARAWEEAHDYFAAALAIFRRMGHRNHQATALGNMGVAMTYQGNLDAAFAYQVEALAIARSLGNKGSTALVNLAVISRKRHDPTAARSFLREALVELESTGQKYHLTGALRETGHLDAFEGNWERSGYLLGAVEALCETLQMVFAPPEAEEMERSRSAIRAAIGEAHLEVAWQTGRHAPLQAVVATALEANRPEILSAKA